MILHDTQSQTDHRQLAIDRVGVKNIRYPIQVRDCFQEGEKFLFALDQSTIATFQLTVDLPHDVKGTHMSRFVEVLQAHGPVLDQCNVETLLAQLAAKLQAQRAQVVIEFPFFLQKKAPVSGLPGLIDYQVRLEAIFEKKREQEGGVLLDQCITVIVPVTTLCPCSKAISRSGAHNQRGEVTFSVKGSAIIGIEKMIRMVEESASAELYSLLKRPDEKFVTEQAYENPVFVEDLVRNIAVRAEAHEKILWYRVEAENFESIHHHNAYALIEKAS